MLHGAQTGLPKRKDLTELSKLIFDHRRLCMSTDLTIKVVYYYYYDCYHHHHHHYHHYYYYYYYYYY